MGTMTSQITSLTIVYSTIYSGADQRKHQSSPSLAFAWGIHRSLVNSPHKKPVTRKMFPFDDVIMSCIVKLVSRSHVNYVAIKNISTQIWFIQQIQARTKIGLFNNHTAFSNAFFSHKMMQFNEGTRLLVYRPQTAALPTDDRNRHIIALELFKWWSGICMGNKLGRRCAGCWWFSSHFFTYTQWVKTLSSPACGWADPFYLVSLPP